MISRDTCEEVYQVLKQMDKMSVMKIPEEILKNITKNRNQNFKSRIDKNDIFNEKNISKEAMDVLCCISYNFWMNDLEKEKIDKIKSDLEQEKKIKYNIENIFKKEQEETKSMIEYKKQTIFEKIKNFLKKYLNKR